VDHRDHVALIGDGVRAAPRGPWLELGAGEGAFTLALADVLGAAASILALDRDGRALDRLGTSIGDRFPAARVETRIGDFTLGLPEGPFAGILSANSLHFVEDLGPVLADIHARLAPDGRLVVVEYDADRGNPWVPHPFSFRRWSTLAQAAGFEPPRLLHRVPSRFLEAIYGADTRPVAGLGLWPSHPHLGG
jgi:SAM-dependent methyltransferase